MDPQFECPSALPSELIGEFPLAAASRSILYQCYYIYVCLCVCVYIYIYAPYIQIILLNIFF